MCIYVQLFITYEVDHLENKRLCNLDEAPNLNSSIDKGHYTYYSIAVLSIFVQNQFQNHKQLSTIKCNKAKNNLKVLGVSTHYGMAHWKSN
jgi:hypothetical protein